MYLNMEFHTEKSRKWQSKGKIFWEIIFLSSLQNLQITLTVNHTWHRFGQMEQTKGIIIINTLYCHTLSLKMPEENDIKASIVDI